MRLLELAQDFGLNLKKNSSCKGGEYHSACPNCREGVDRFIVWPALNRYWCRRCDVSGDAIQFCRNFLGMSFKEACYKTNEANRIVKDYEHYRFVQENFITAAEPTEEWQNKAKAFVEWSYKKLSQSSIVIEALLKRGLNEMTINKFKLGYCANDFYRDRENWGLPREVKENGKEKRLWLPHGLVIPTMSLRNQVFKLKIRRQQWHEGDHSPKYVEISGSMQSPSIYGTNEHKVTIVVESELDAMLIQQEASDICFCIATGGVSKKPDLRCDRLLKETKLILWCLDNDEAGKNAAFWWRNAYRHLKFWPIPIGKSPGNAFVDHGINLREWILKGIKFYSQFKDHFEAK